MIASRTTTLHESGIKRKRQFHLGADYTFARDTAINMEQSPLISINETAETGAYVPVLPPWERA